LVNDVTMTVVLPRLPASAFAVVTLVTDVTMTYCYQGYQCFCRCRGYLGYWRHHDCTCCSYLDYWHHRDCTFTNVTSVSVVAVVSCYHDYKAYSVRTCLDCSQSWRHNRRPRTVTML
jgi:hypothetical protein